MAPRSFVFQMTRQNRAPGPETIWIKEGDLSIKKTVSVCMTAAMALSLLAGGAVQASALSAETAEPVSAVAEENCISGSWKRAADPTLTVKVRKTFDKAFDGLEGVSYTPVAVLASRTTASGRQYRVLCKATVVYPGAEMHYAVVDVYESLEGNANIISVTDGYVS